MAQRIRKHVIGYGGWTCGKGPFSSSVIAKEPYFSGEHSCVDETSRSSLPDWRSPLSEEKESLH